MALGISIIDSAGEAPSTTTSISARFTLSFYRRAWFVMAPSRRTVLDLVDHSRVRLYVPRPVT